MIHNNQQLYSSANTSSTLYLQAALMSNQSHYMNNTQKVLHTPATNRLMNTKHVSLEGGCFALCSQIIHNESTSGPVSTGMGTCMRATKHISL